MLRNSPRVIRAAAPRAYVVELEFSDGVRGSVDLRDWIVGRGPMFKLLEDPTFFAQVRLTTCGGAIEWPNGVDFCPDVLYEQVKSSSAPGTTHN